MPQRETPVPGATVDDRGNGVRPVERSGRHWRGAGSGIGHDRRHPPSGARLLRVAHARSECVSATETRSLGWLVAIGAAVFLCVLGVGLLANRMAEPVPADATTVVWVQSGESLWDVARRAAPGADPHATTERIRELNGMTEVALSPGQPLRVPSGR